MIAVKFDTEQLPPILNALETDNGGNKLILEVAVRTYTEWILTIDKTDISNSNIWERVLYDALLWMVCDFEAALMRLL